MKGGSMGVHGMSQVHIAGGPRSYVGALWCTCGQRFEGTGAKWAGLWVSLVEAHTLHRDEQAQAGNALALAGVAERDTTHPPP